MGWFKTKSSGQTTPDYTGLQLQTAVNTLPVPIVWGMSKIAPNVIWYSNFQTKNGSSASGGKGFFHTASAEVTYSADLILALSEGPIEGVNRIWKDQSTYTLDSLGLSFFRGTTPQGVWGYLASSDPAQALAYQGTAYVCAASYALGDQADISNHNFEVQGVAYATGINGVDADPAFCINDFLTNPQYGIGFNPASIALSTLFGTSGDSSLQTYCRAMGICFSPALTDQEQASGILARWLQICNCAAVWSGGQLRFISYADAGAVGNGYTFVANVETIYSLDDNDFVPSKGDDPLTVSRLDPFSLPTIQRVEVMDRTNEYGLTPVEARDQSQIELYGPLLGSTITAHEICDVTIVAPIVAQTILQRGLYIRANFNFKLSWLFCLLDPMDLVEVSDANLGLSATPVRITSIEEDEKGVLTFAAEEFVTDVATPVLYPTASAASNIPNFNVAPGDVNAPIFLEPPDQLSRGLWVVFGLSGKDTINWGGCIVWVSSDEGGPYSSLGQVTGATRMGVLAAPLARVAASPSGATIDAANTLMVDLSESNGALASGSAADLAAFNTALVVDQEIIAYQTATLTGANRYSLTTLSRGGYGAPIAAHAAGAPVMRLDGTSFAWNYTSDRIGSTLYFKFTSFNTRGVAAQDLADVGAYAYTITGAALSSPLPDVSGVYSNFVDGFQYVYWNEITDFRNGIVYEIRQGSTWATALLICTQAHAPFVARGNGAFWIAARCTPATGLTVYSENPQSITIQGNQLALNIVKSWDEQATGWTGTFDNGIGTDGAGATKFLRLASSVNILATSPLVESVATSAAAASGNVLTFANVPAGVEVGMAVADETNPGVLAVGVTILERTATTVTISANVLGGGVGNGDTIAFSTADIVNAGGIIVNTPLHYTAPADHIIDIGYVARAYISGSSEFIGIPVGQNVLSISDFLNTPDVLGSASTRFVSGWLEVAIATAIDNDVFAPTDEFSVSDVFTGPFSFGPWQKLVPGVQLGRAFWFRLAMMTTDPDTIAYAPVFNYSVQVQARIDHYQNLSVPATGLTIIFRPDGAGAPGAFNAGPPPGTLPTVNVDWAMQAAVDYTIAGLSPSQLTIAFFDNSGAPVAATGVTVIVEGY
jgi:hypothetical protein